MNKYCGNNTIKFNLKKGGRHVISSSQNLQRNRRSLLSILCRHSHVLQHNICFSPTKPFYGCQGVLTSYITQDKPHRIYTYFPTVWKQTLRLDKQALRAKNILHISNRSSKYNTLQQNLNKTRDARTTIQDLNTK